MDRIIEIGERILGTTIIVAAVAFSFAVMSGILNLGPEWGVFADAKKAQVVFQVSLWMVAFLTWDWATPGRTLAALFTCDNPLAHPEEKKAASILYAGVAIALAILIGNGAF